jgi:peptide/nickel transport system permease protein
VARGIAIRLVRLIITLLAVSFGSFMLLNLLPGDPATQILGLVNLNPANVARVHHELGLDKPLLQRYVDWLGGVVTGDWGESYRTHEPVLRTIMQRLPLTLELAVLAQVLALIVAILIGLASAPRPGSLVDRTSSATAFGMLSIPNFVLGLALIYFLAVQTGGWLPATGYVPVSQGLGQNLRSLVLPVLTLAAAPAAVYARVLRSEMIVTLREDYIAFARAKGLPPRQILLRHALRPSSMPLLTLSGINFGVLLGGAFVIEDLFALPGVGSLGVNAIYSHDYLVVQGVVLFVALLYVLVNFAVDLLYSVVDPRVRQGARR